MPRWSCAACCAMTDDLWGACAGCRDLRPIEDGWPAGPTLVVLYPADTQVDGTTRYRDHADLLAAVGDAPVAASWGEERPGAGSVVFFGNLEEAYRAGTLLVTYRSDTRP